MSRKACAHPRAQPRTRALAAVAVLVLSWVAVHRAASPVVQFVFTSDLHYGLSRERFRAHTDVSAHIVNLAMIERIRQVPGVRFPADGGVGAGERVGPLDFVAVGGDIANRQEHEGEKAVQRAGDSWAQFKADYLDGLQLATSSGAPTPLYLVPGNHDASNAVGFYKPMTPLVDPTSMIEIYNRMMAPAVPKTAATYTYATDRVLSSRDVGGVHLVFVTIWPDSIARAWLETDLQRVSAATPVLIFAHDQPGASAKHFINPNGAHDVNADDRFENLLADRFADGSTTDTAPAIEQRAFEAFLGRHPNITAYFHGDSNWNEFYDWTGPDHAVVLHTFRADSPMKGAQSGSDETKLSFHVATIDPASRRMTVRECLWNLEPGPSAAAVHWGDAATVSLAPRHE